MAQKPWFVQAGFSLVWIANVYMSLFGLIRIDMKKEKTEAELAEERMKEKKLEKEEPK